MTVWPTLIVQGFVGIILYVGMARIFKLECFTYLLFLGGSTQQIPAIEYAKKARVWYNIM